MTALGRRALLAGVLAVLATPLTGVAVAATAAAPQFGRAVGLKLPLNAGPGTPIIESATCAQAGSCTLAGVYSDGSGVEQAMVVTRSGGRWGRATELLLPSNADPALGAVAESVSCTRVGSCVAVGDYRTASLFEAFTATESHGSWRQGHEVKLPPNSTTTSNATVDAVACTGPGSCVAAGDYGDKNGHNQAMVVTETHGKWSAGREIRPPSTAGSAGGVFLTGIACPKLGSCVAVGTFTDKAGSPRPMAVSESGGRWRQAIQLTLPKDAAHAQLVVVVPMSVACSGVGNCVVVGSYRNLSGRFVPMSMAESHGSWARAQHVTRVPANAATQPNLALTSVACPQTGPCVASGGYTLKSGGTGAVILAKSGTRWTTATQIRTPPDAATAGHQIAQARAIGCATTGFCAIGGTYRTTSATTRVMAATG